MAMISIFSIWIDILTPCSSLLELLILPLGIHCLVKRLARGSRLMTRLRLQQRFHPQGVPLSVNYREI
jgi:hypothetical protein